MLKLSNQELKRKSIEEFKSSVKTPIIIVLDNVRSLNNVGSVFRTSDAFLIQAIYLCGITGIPPHKEIQKTALGATETVEWKYFETTLIAIDELKKINFEVYAIEQAQEAIPLNSFILSKNKLTAFVFGNEINGVNQDVINNCNGVIEIPQSGSKHSLNIAVTVGIVIWQAIQSI